MTKTIIVRYKDDFREVIKNVLFYEIIDKQFLQIRIDEDKTKDCFINIDSIKWFNYVEGEEE